MPQIPKREAELARPRARKGGDQKPALKGVRFSPTIPAADPEWHPIAAQLYNSLHESGQADFYQSSDWAFAFSVCDDLSRFKMEEDRRDEGLAQRELWDRSTAAEREAAGLDPKTAPYVPKGGSAMKLVSAMDALGRLAVTEVDRLKVRMELQEPSDPEASAEVIAIADAKKRLGA